MLLRVSLFMSFLVSASACGRLPSQAQPNRAMQVSVDGTVDLKRKIVTELIASNGWWLAHEDRATGRIVALTDIDDGQGMVTRQRWVFVVDENSVSVQSFLDYVRGGQWQTSPSVCDGYNYYREKHHLSAIEGRVANEQSLRSVARSVRQ